MNRILDLSPLYAGSIGQVQFHLWRGAYSIQDVRISKTTGMVPVPFFQARRIDFAIQWNAVLHGRVVGQVLMEQPQINFTDAPDQNETQTGTGGAWLHIISDLFPFKINHAVIRQGAVHFHVFQAETPVDVYLSQLEASVNNLGNIRDETTPLVASVQAKGLVMDQANFAFKMTLDPFSYRPTFHLATRLLGLDVRKINDLALAYGNFDFQNGWFDFVLEMDAKEGLVTGYAKPLFRDIQVFSLRQDLAGNPLNALWQALLGATTQVLENPSRDQFGTLIPFTGDLSGVTTADLLATVANLLRNAFVRAYLPRLERGSQSIDGLEFEPPQMIESLTVGDTY